MAGAPKGNNNAGKGREFYDALRYVLLNMGEDGKVPRKEPLYKVAAALVANAIDGDNSAIKEVADRLDGKAVQSVQSDITHNYAISPEPLNSDEWMKQHTSGDPKQARNTH